MAVISYMQRRRSGTYEFRRRLPEALAGKAAPAHVRAIFPELVNPKTGAFKRELVRSLDTKDVNEGKRRDHREASRVVELFEAAVEALSGRAVAALTEADIREIADEAKASILAADEAEREEGDDRRTLFTQEERARRWPDLVPIPMASARGMSKDHFAAYGDELEAMTAEYADALARRDIAIVEPELRAALRKRGINLDPTALDWRRLGVAILGAVVDGFDGVVRRQRGENVPTMTVGANRGPTLAEAFASWQAGSPARGAKRPSARTLVEADHAVRRFREMHGDMRLGDITKEKARGFRDAMAKLPKRLPRKLSKLPAPLLLQRDLSAYPARSATAVNKMLVMLRAIASFADREGLMDKVPGGWANPFAGGVRLTVDDHGEDVGRQPFEREELRSIFSTTIYTAGERPRGGGGEASFWFPLVGMLSGLRLEEIAGLRIADLAEDEETGRWYFEVSTKGGRRLKTASSARRVPAHGELERIGLLSYRQSLLDAGARLNDPLWPNVKSADGRPRSAAWSKWFGRWLRSAARVADRSKVFHSFRHTFKRLARDGGLSEEVHDALTGHVAGGVGRGYGKGFSLRPMIEAVDKITSPIDLTRIRWTGARSGERPRR